MAKTYRDIAIGEMLGTVEEAMSQAKAASRDMGHLFIGTPETGDNHELRKHLTPGPR